MREKMRRLLFSLLSLFGFIPFFAILFFLGAVFWAKEEDPFSRKWVFIKTIDQNSFLSVTVFPKLKRATYHYPVIIYAHGWNGKLLQDGNELRQMAELGLAAISFEYNQTNELAFDTQFKALLHYLSQQDWVNTNAIAWVGFSMGANQMFKFLLQYPEQQPQLLVQLSGAGLLGNQFNGSLKSLRCPVLLIHGDQDQIFPISDTKQLSSIFQTNGLSIELKIMPGIPHGMEPEREVVFRGIGEYCLTHIGDKDSWQNYYSSTQWRAKAPPLWLFWLPTVAWLVSWLVYNWRTKIESLITFLKRGEITLQSLAILLVIWASTTIAIHVMSPKFRVSEVILGIAKKFLLQPKEYADFEYLAAQPIWQGQRLKTLLEHAELANYNRELIGWKFDDKTYQDFVLSPIITHSSNEQLNWRRLFWEEFYPRIRHESSLEDAAKIVVRHLRERVTIAKLPGLPHDVPDIWIRQITDELGFQITCVAALRSVGIPAQLNTNQKAEFWDGKQWQITPLPSVITW